MKRKLIFWMGVGCAVLLAPLLARSQGRANSSEGASPSGPGSGRPASTPATSGSRMFAPGAAKTASRSTPEALEERKLLAAAASASLLATRAGSLAATKAGSAEVRAFATGLVGHHESARPDLLRLLQARGMAMPMLDTGQAHFLKRLAGMSGKSFDREFMNGAGAEAIRRELRALESAAQTGRDPALKAWAEASLPGLRRHLAVAERTGAGAQRTTQASPAPAAAAAQGKDVKPVGARLSGSSSR